MRFLKHLISMYAFLFFCGAVDMLFNINGEWSEIGNWQAWIIYAVAVLIIGFLGTLVTDLVLLIFKLFSRKH